MRKYFLCLILGVLLLSFVSSFSCNASSISRNIFVGETPSPAIISCNNDYSSAVDISEVNGDSFSFSPATISANSTTNISIIFSQMNSASSTTGYLFFGSAGIYIPIYVNATEEVAEGGIIVSPVSQIINVKQGQIKTKEIQVIIPENYPSDVNFHSVYFNPDKDVVYFDDIELGIRNPGQTFSIPLIIDATDVQIGTYSTKISIVATDPDEVHLPDVSLQIIVSVGVSPVNNNTFADRPDCSLSALEFNLNNTYVFTCTNVVDNLEVNIPYNEYLEGLYGGPSSEGLYKYYFKAKKLGTSTFIATFEYGGATYFEAFEKDFKVTKSGNSIVGGVDLDLEFFQGGAKKTKDELQQGETVLIAIDKLTGSAVFPFTVILNGEDKNSSKIDMETGKVYNLRVVADGYNDYVLDNLNVSQTPISIFLNPSKVQYSVGEILTISTVPANASLIFDGTIVTGNTLQLTREGFSVLEAVKQGFSATKMNLSVLSKVNIECSPTRDKWKKGTKVTCQIPEVAYISVSFQKKTIKDDLAEMGEVEILKEGTGDIVTFKIPSYGFVDINIENVNVLHEEILKKGNWFSNLFKNKIFWIITSSFIALGGIIFLIKFKGSSGGGIDLSTLPGSSAPDFSD